jgi:hypothetical protein
MKVSDHLCVFEQTLRKGERLNVFVTSPILSEHNGLPLCKLQSSFVQAFGKISLECHQILCIYTFGGTLLPLQQSLVDLLFGN